MPRARSVCRNVFVLVVIVVADDADNALPRTVDVVKVAPQVTVVTDHVVVHLNITELLLIIYC